MRAEAELPQKTARQSVRFFQPSISTHPVIDQIRIGRKTFSSDRFSCVTNFGCENSGQCKKRLQPNGNAHLMENVLDVGRTDKPVLVVFRLAKSLACEKTVQMEVSKNTGRLHAHQQ